MMGPIRLRQFALGVSSLAVVAGGAVWICGPDTPLAHRITGLLSAVAGASIVLYQWRMRRLVRLSGAELCLGCSYSMHGLPKRQACPRCGRPYSSTESERFLRRYGPLLRHSTTPIPRVQPDAPPSAEELAVAQPGTGAKLRPARLGLTRRLWGIDDAHVLSQVEDACQSIQQLDSSGRTRTLEVVS